MTPSPPGSSPPPISPPPPPTSPPPPVRSSGGKMATPTPGPSRLPALLGIQPPSMTPSSPAMGTRLSGMKPPGAPVPQVIANRGVDRPAVIQMVDDPLGDVPLSGQVLEVLAALLGVRVRRGAHRLPGQGPRARPHRQILGPARLLAFALDVALAL